MFIYPLKSHLWHFFWYQLWVRCGTRHKTQVTQKEINSYLQIEFLGKNDFYYKIICFKNLWLGVCSEISKILSPLRYPTGKREGKMPTMLRMIAQPEVWGRVTRVTYHQARTLGQEGSSRRGNAKPAECHGHRRALSKALAVWGGVRPWEPGSVWRLQPGHWRHTKTIPAFGPPLSRELTSPGLIPSLENEVNFFLRVVVKIKWNTVYEHLALAMAKVVTNSSWD